MQTILCIATFFKGGPFLEECHRQGWSVILLTAESLAGADWPRQAIAEIHTIRQNASKEELEHQVTAIARRHPVARVAALDDFDVETGATIREFLQAPGFGATVANRFRDKLTMRSRARSLGLAVPEFTAVFNDAEVSSWVSRVAPPWVLKPRSSAASTGIRKITGADHLRQTLESLGDSRGSFLLEQFVTGDVYHVDAIVRRGKIVLAVPSKYGTPPMKVAHEGGVFVTRRLRDRSADARRLLAANRTLLTGFELKDGVSHSEFIAGATGLHFLETAARVGGAYIVDMIEAGTGLNFWREWAKIALAGEDGPYEVPKPRSDASGIALCLARQDEPDLSSFADPEIAVRIRKHHHAGLIVKSADYARVEALLAQYVERFSRDFLATMPVPERPAQ